MGWDGKKRGWEGRGKKGDEKARDWGGGEREVPAGVTLMMGGDSSGPWGSGKVVDGGSCGSLGSGVEDGWWWSDVGEVGKEGLEDWVEVKFVGSAAAEKYKCDRSLRIHTHTSLLVWLSKHAARCTFVSRIDSSAWSVVGLGDLISGKQISNHFKWNYPTMVEGFATESVGTKP